MLKRFESATMRSICNARPTRRIAESDRPLNHDRSERQPRPPLERVPEPATSTFHTPRPPFPRARFNTTGPTASEMEARPEATRRRHTTEHRCPSRRSAFGRGLLWSPAYSRRLGARSPRRRRPQVSKNGIEDRTVAPSGDRVHAHEHAIRLQQPLARDSCDLVCVHNRLGDGADGVQGTKDSIESRSACL